MLVLSRQRDETIVINDNIQITVVDIRGDKVRLGISAPPDIPVHRKEVYESMQKENKEQGKNGNSGTGKVMSLANKKGKHKKEDEAGK